MGTETSNVLYNALLLGQVWKTMYWLRTGENSTFTETALTKSSSFAFPGYISGVHHFGWEFWVCYLFFFLISNHWNSHIPSSWMVHAGCVSVAGIHPSRAWMSGSSESVAMEWMCAHTRPRFIISSERVLGEWSQNPCQLQGQNPLYRKKNLSSEEERTHDAASCRTASPTSYSGPRSRRWTRLSCPCQPPPRGPGGKAPASWAADLSSILSFAQGLFVGRVIPVTATLEHQWLHYQAPGVFGSALGLAGPVSVYYE